MAREVPLDKKGLASEAKLSSATPGVSLYNLVLAFPIETAFFYA